MIATYILLCNNGHYYVGSMSNLKRRLDEHQKGLSKATKGKLPVKLVYKKEFKVLRKARKFEYFLKRQRNKRFYQKLFENKIKLDPVV